MDNKKWYMITTVSGKEEKVVEALRNRVISEEKTDVFEDFKVMMVPYIPPKELKKKLNGEDYATKTRSLFPGYIFIKMDMTNDAWFMVRNTQYVTGLVGSSGQRAKPTPISDLKMKKMERKVKEIEENFANGIIETDYAVGSFVVINDGPFKGQGGLIVEKNDAELKAVVEIEQFGRKTPTTFDYSILKIKS